jgi:uracil-DNA glycosylase family 4
MNQDCKTLPELWEKVNRLTKENFPHNELMPILGGGQEKNPKLMIVFINPTQRNISSSKDWEGPRFPFIGRKRPWIEFHEAGLFDDELIKKVKADPVWSVDFADEVLDFLRSKGLYLTNIVKNTGHNADLPRADQINLYLPFFKKEIELVNPSYIVAFGLIPINALLDENIKLSDYYDSVKKKGNVIHYDLEINSKKYRLIPCYYPIGRGNPKKAVEILKLISKL